MVFPEIKNIVIFSFISMRHIHTTFLHLLYHILRSNSRAFASSCPNHAEGVYIIRNLLRYIIRPKVWISSSRRKDARWRVMRYSPAGADDMHRTSRGDDIPSLREPPKLAHSLRGTPTAAWINKTEHLSVDKCSVFVGGGWWIRTTEVSDNRFTVCPLWPLGKSPIIGAGERSRTINRLITNQVLCH